MDHNNMTRDLEYVLEEQTYILFENSIPVALIHLTAAHFQRGVDDAVEHCWFAGESLNTIEALVK